VLTGWLKSLWRRISMKFYWKRNNFVTVNDCILYTRNVNGTVVVHPSLWINVCLRLHAEIIVFMPPVQCSAIPLSILLSRHTSSFTASSLRRWCTFERTMRRRRAAGYIDSDCQFNLPNGWKRKLHLLKKNLTSKERNLSVIWGGFNEVDCVECFQCSGCRC